MALLKVEDLSLGYESQTVTVRPGQHVTIVLEEENTILDDAVVVGRAPACVLEVGP